MYKKESLQVVGICRKMLKNREFVNFLLREEIIFLSFRFGWRRSTLLHAFGTNPRRCRVFHLYASAYRFSLQSAREKATFPSCV